MSRSRTRTALLLCLIGLAASLALATGATVIDGPADTLADDRVAIQPADGPNGEYAYLDGDDELVIMSRRRTRTSTASSREST